MKNVVSVLAALSLVAPSVASAATTAPNNAARALSVEAAAMQPVRASAKAGKKKAVATPLLILLVAGVAGGIAAAVSGDSR